MSMTMVELFVVVDVVVLVERIGIGIDKKSRMLLDHRSIDLALMLYLKRFDSMMGRCIADSTMCYLVCIDNSTVIDGRRLLDCCYTIDVAVVVVGIVRFALCCIGQYLVKTVAIEMKIANYTKNLLIPV